ncbi:uncharacterized protein LOC124720512 isoform X2 [Schistocerca piceifrons]|uniref:uncharacterized protein LOC124720512 isoform X2 n=1 Tax=Schistocerca piceifrons TaxID=274613 RepID=UPI001F5F6113|nr:uncharacterized protein LOC124720512 isoform X2 [Schistocerca piceifrons]
MDSKGTSWLKKEKNEVYAEPGSLVQLHTSTMKVKEELDEQVNQQVLTVFHNIPHAGCIGCYVMSDHFISFFKIHQGL